MNKSILVFPLLALSMCIAPGISDHSIGPVMANYRPLKQTAPGVLQMTVISFFAGYTRPVYATEVPRSKQNFTYTTACYAYLYCVGRKDIGSMNAGNPLVAIHSVDERLSATHFIYIGHSRETRINGWTRDAWVKEFGSLESIPESARIAHRVELKDGTVFERSYVQWQGSDLLIVQDDGGMHVALGDQVKAIL